MNPNGTKLDSIEVSIHQNLLIIHGNQGTLKLESYDLDKVGLDQREITERANDLEIMTLYMAEPDSLKKFKMGCFGSFCDGWRPQFILKKESPTTVHFDLFLNSCALIRK